MKSNNVGSLEQLRHIHDQAVPDDRVIRIWDALDDDRCPENCWGMDLQQPEWVSKVHNTQTGRVFILGTGPSLLKEREILPFLVKEQTWTVNRANFIDYLGFKPTHHSITEPGPILDWGRMIHPYYDFPGALNRIAVHWFPITAPGWLWCAKAIDDIQIRWHGFFGLGESLPPLPTGWASPLTLCQLAAWLGYTEFYFLGVDTSQGGQAWDPKSGTRQARSIVSIMECFDRARAQIEKAGRKIYDCSDGGRLNQEGILPYVALSEVLGVGSHVAG